jgi:hypothetical protein
MAKKPRLSKLSDSDEEYLSTKARKQRSEAVSDKARFDQTDVENMQRLFAMYDRYTGGRLRKMIADNKLEVALNNKEQKWGPIESAEKFAFFFPKDLQEEVEKYWPSLWTNKEHARQFLKKFPEFRR